MMKVYSYNFETRLEFGHPVRDHQWTVRMLPFVCDYQTILEEDYAVSPYSSIKEDKDSFGNRIVYGTSINPHSDFVFASRGKVRLGAYLDRQVPEPFYYQQSQLTLCSDEMISFGKSIRSNGKTLLDRAREISESVHEYMTYTKGMTTTKTSAKDSFIQAKGVCQDYAHITLALLRNEGIACRYVVGYIPGEGETHAWIEVSDNNMWYGLDPTHNKLIESGYLKIAHGRDFNDCSVDRGVFTGNPLWQNVKVKVEMKEV